MIRQRICTTKEKAKEARKLVDRLITLGKNGTLAARRRAFAILCDHGLVSQLFNSIAGRFNLRAGGYTRVIPLGNRRGDNAQLAFLELTEKDKIIISKTKTEAQAKTQTQTKSAGSAPVEKKKTRPEKTAATLEPEELKKDKPQKTEITKTHSKKDITQEKPKFVPKFLSGIRKMFTRKSPSGS